jgi:hypothetical protein
MQRTELSLINPEMPGISDWFKENPPPDAY